MKTKRFLIEAAIFSIALALTFSGCGDSGGGGDTLAYLGDEHDDDKVVASEPDGEPVVGGNEPDNGEASSSSSSEIAALPSSNSVGSGSCAGFVEGTKREHYGKEKKQFCDERDGKKYVYVTIGNLTWMAENLNYETEGSLCADNDPNNCEKYGRLYDWYEAETACPAGWHFASKDDWEDLTSFVIEDMNSSSQPGVKLMAFGDGTDNYGFSALPGGITDGVTFLKVGKIAYFWTGTEGDPSDTRAYQFAMDYTLSSFYYTNSKKTNKESVRCVRDVKDEVEQVVAGPTCAGNPQNYDPALYECREGKNGVYLKEYVSYEGDTYEAVLIGSQTWMTKNLTYKATNSICDGIMGSYAVQGNGKTDVFTVSTGGSKCVQYGGGMQYDWVTAMDIEPIYLIYKYNPATPKHKGICPEGWHVPSQAEKNTMLLYVNNGNNAYGNSVGISKKLRASPSSIYAFYSSMQGGALLNEEWYGTDDFGFQLLPHGSDLWTSTDGNSGNGNPPNYSTAASFGYNLRDKSDFKNIRCLKD